MRIKIRSVVALLVFVLQACGGDSPQALAWAKTKETKNGAAKMIITTLTQYGISAVVDSVESTHYSYFDAPSTRCEIVGINIGLTVATGAHLNFSLNTSDLKNPPFKVLPVESDPYSKLRFNKTLFNYYEDLLNEKYGKSLSVSTLSSYLTTTIDSIDSRFIFYSSDIRFPSIDKDSDDPEQYSKFDIKDLKEFYKKCSDSTIKAAAFVSFMHTFTNKYGIIIFSNTIALKNGQNKLSNDEINLAKKKIIMAIQSDKKLPDGLYNFYLFNDINTYPSKPEKFSIDKVN